MVVGEYCNREVVIVEADESIEKVARLMRQHHTGDLIVVDNLQSRLPVGIVTDRDLVIEILAVSLDYWTLTAGDVMSDELLTVKENDSLADVLQKMSSKGVRRTPVLNNSGHIEGIFTLDDFIEVLTELTRQMTTLVRNEQVRERDRRN